LFNLNNNGGKRLVLDVTRGLDLVPFPQPGNYLVQRRQ
jgi:hypothetical protein